MRFGATANISTPAELMKVLGTIVRLRPSRSMDQPAKGRAMTFTNDPMVSTLPMVSALNPNSSEPTKGISVKRAPVRVKNTAIETAQTATKLRLANRLSAPAWLAPPRLRAAGVSSSSPRVSLTRTKPQTNTATDEAA